jgi:outer membrane murein-binding lipoprotein Lpp
LSAARLRLRLALAATVAATVLSGCSGGPNQANIVLRKENQQLNLQMDDLKRQDYALQAQIAAIQSRPGATTQELPESRLDELFTTHGLEFGRATGGFSNNPYPPDQMVQVFVVPTDESGQALKAAGSFRIQLFDLAEPKTQIGQWDYSTEQARQHWYGQAFLYTYQFDCPWQIIPQHANLLLKVTFTDALTGRQFSIDKNITVKPPLASSEQK